MVGMAILQPLIALAAWTMVMWAGMYATRIPAITAAKLDNGRMANLGSSGFDGILPNQVQRKAHNYNHLHEAPTVFYAVALVLAVIGQGDGHAAYLGWSYFGLRVVHSLVQVTVNRVILRFALFMGSSGILIMLIVRAAIALF